MINSNCEIGTCTKRAEYHADYHYFRVAEFGGVGGTGRVYVCAEHKGLGLRDEDEVDLTPVSRLEVILGKIFRLD